MKKLILILLFITSLSYSQSLMTASPATTFGGILHFNGNTGLTTSLQTVYDGLGNVSALQLSSNSVNVVGTLYVNGISPFDTITMATTSRMNDSLANMNLRKVAYSDTGSVIASQYLMRKTVGDSLTNYTVFKGIYMDTMQTNPLMQRNLRIGTASIFTGITGYSVDNTAIGLGTMESAISINQNTFTGWEAGLNLRYGDYNSAYGEQTMYRADSLYNNNAFGAKTLFALVNGYGGNAAFGTWSLGQITGGTNNTAMGQQSGYNPVVILDSLNFCTFLGASTSSSVNNVTNSMALGYGAQVSASNQVVIGNTNITNTVLYGIVDMGASGSNSGLIIHGINFPTDHSGDGDLSVYTNDVYSIDKGATLMLGGYSDTVSGVYSIFGQISGRKENATKGDGSGYLEFDVPNASSTQREAMRINSHEELQIGSKTDLGNYLLQVSGNSIITGTSTFDSTTSFLQAISAQAISAKEIDLTNYNNGNVGSITFSAGNPTGNIGIEQNSGNFWIGANATQIASTNNQAYNNNAYKPSRILFAFSGTPLQIQVAGLGTAGNPITWVNALSFDDAGLATFNGHIIANFDSATCPSGGIYLGSDGNLHKHASFGNYWLILLGIILPFLYHNRKRLFGFLLIAFLLISVSTFAQSKQDSINVQQKQYQFQIEVQKEQQLEAELNAQKIKAFDAWKGWQIAAQPFQQAIEQKKKKD